jgi:hypothetical protein
MTLIVELSTGSLILLLIDVVDVVDNIVDNIVDRN